VGRDEKEHEDQGGQECKSIKMNISNVTKSSMIHGENENLDAHCKSRDNQGSQGGFRSIDTAEKEKIRNSASSSVDSPKDAIKYKHEDFNKLSKDHGDDDGTKSTENGTSRKRSKKKKSKKSKKSKKKDYTDENYNKKVKKKKSKRKLACFEESIIKKLDEKPLVPYDNPDDTTTDGSVENTEVADDSKKRYPLEREIGGKLLPGGVKESIEIVSKQGPALNDYSDYQISRKSTELTSTTPDSSKWNKHILNGNNDSLEDTEVLKSKLELEYNNTLEFVHTEKPKINGGCNMLKRALANIIEKEKLKVDEFGEEPNVKQKKRKIKKKKKRRKELSNDEDSDEKSSMLKSKKTKEI